MNAPHDFRRSRLALAVGAAIAAGAMGLPAHADTFTVTIATDTVDDDGETSFREAVTAANNTAGLDTIDFAQDLHGGVIEVDHVSNGFAFIRIEDDTIIEGPGSGELTFSAVANAGTTYVGAFNHSSGDLSVSGLTFNGENSDARSGIFADNFGSAPLTLSLQDVVFEHFTSDALRFHDDDTGVLELSDAVFRDNDTNGNAALQARGDEITIRNSRFVRNSNTGAGGAIRLFATSSADIMDSTITDNQSAVRGGGMAIGAAPGVVTITASTIADNEAADGGGGIYFEPEGVDGPSTLRIVDSTISGNSTANSNFGSNQVSGSGGGLLVANEPDMDYTLAIVQSTFSGNTSAAVGGAIYIGTRTADTDIDIDFSTLTDNTAEFSGGILAANTGGADIDVSNTVIAGNTGNQDAKDAGDVVTGTMTDGDNINISFSYFGAVGGNIADDGNSMTNAGDPGLGALGTAPYGNMKTEVHIPMEGSNLIDIGDPALTAGNGGTPVNDQTGIERIVNGIIDIGAVEFNPDPPTSGGGGGGGGAIGGGLLGLLAGLLFRRRLRE